MTLKINKPEINIREEISKISNKVTFDEVVRGLGEYTGNVGIGTTEPDEKLTILDNIKPVIRLVGNGNNVAGTNFGEIQFYNSDNSGDGPNVAASIHAQSTSSTGSGGFLVFSTENSVADGEGRSADPRMVIDQEGNVGIGTTGPGTKLYIEGNDFNSSALTLKRTSTGVNNDPGIVFQSDAGENDGYGLGAIYFKTNEDGNAYAKIRAKTDDVTGASGRLELTASTNAVINSSDPSMVIKSSGYVGIGTPTPAAKLEIKGGVNAFPVTDISLDRGTSLRVRGNDNAVIDMGTNGGNGTWIQARNKVTDNIQYDLSINPLGGNVGIGTTDPDYQFEVACYSSEYSMYAITKHNGAGWGALYGGKIEYTMPSSSSASSRSWAVGQYKPTDTVHAATTMRFNSRDNGQAFLWMDDNNVLRFGTNASYIGSTTGTSLGTALTTSDERAKNIESGFEYGLDHVMQLQPIAFAFKKDAKQTRTLGFGASASQEIIPESVFDTGNCIDGYDEHPEHEGMNQPKSDDTELGMDYVQLIPVLTKAIQEQQQIIEDLKSRIETLESK